MRRFSWSMRFALALSAVFAIGTLSAGGLSYLFLSREMSNRLAADVRASAESLAQILAAGDRADLEELIAAQVRTAQGGSSLYAYTDAASGVTIGSLHVSAPFEGARRLQVGRDLPAPPSTQPQPPDAYLAYGIRTDSGWVMAARDEAWVAESGEILIQTTAWALAVALSLSVALALAIARRNERRIDAMEGVLDAVGAGHLDRRIGDHGNDDLADLARQVDQTLDRLDAGVAAIRQVSTDVAHDLRAPLARLRMRLEPLALSPGMPAYPRHEIGSALQDIDAIAETFDAILRLALLQSDGVGIRCEPVDLGDLVAGVCDLLAPSAEDSGHTLVVEGPATPVGVNGDADLLAQALTNLVDNALRHCPAPVTVTVAVTVEQGHPVLSVCDTGPGIPAADRRRVLERFVRLDASRGVRGTGLGLSLVAVIADRHGAGLSLDDNQPGLRVRIVFPARV